MKSEVATMNREREDLVVDADEYLRRLTGENR